MNLIDYRISDKRGRFTIEQAGIAQQIFEATEAYVTVALEDQYGHLTDLFEIVVWFANTDITLIGFEGLLDRSVLYIDMQQRQAWLEIDV